MYRKTQQLPVMPPLTQVEAIKIESLASRDSFVEMQMKYTQTQTVRIVVRSARPLSTGKNGNLEEDEEDHFSDGAMFWKITCDEFCEMIGDEHYDLCTDAEGSTAECNAVWAEAHGKCMVEICGIED